MVQMLTLIGLFAIQSLQPPPAGNPFLIRMHALALSAHRSESPVRPPTKFLGRLRPPNFLSSKQLGPAGCCVPSWVRETGKFQFTKRRTRTLFTRPSMRKMDNMLEPPALINGRGTPVTST